MAGAAGGIAGVLAARGGDEGSLCADLAGRSDVLQYVRLVEDFVAAGSGDWAGYLAQATAACPETVAALFDAQPGLVAPPTQIDWHVGPNVIDWEEEKASEMVATAQTMVAFYAGGPLPRLSVHLDTDRATLARAMGGRYEESFDRLGQGMWFGGPGAIYVNLSQLRLRYPDDFPVVAHEVMHVFQLWLASPLTICPGARPDVAADGPAWLIEGSAQQVGATALVDGPYWPLPGRSSDPSFLTRDMAAAGYASGASLRDLASWYTWNAEEPAAAYSLAYSGAAALAAAAGNHSLFDYFRTLGRGECWEAAFEAAFGLTPDSFYDRFEAAPPPSSAPG